MGTSADEQLSCAVVTIPSPAWIDTVRSHEFESIHINIIIAGFRPSNPGSSGINLGGSKTERIEQITIDGLLLGHNPVGFPGMPKVEGSKINFIKVGGGSPLVEQQHSSCSIERRQPAHSGDGDAGMPMRPTCRKLNDLLRSPSWPPSSQIDTEGYDVAVIAGMLQTFTDGKVPHMLIEFSPGDAAGTAGE